MYYQTLPIGCCIGGSVLQTGLSDPPELWQAITEIFNGVVDSVIRFVNWIFCGRSLRERAAYIDPISNGLAQFDNPSINGQVNGIYITTNERGLEQTREFLIQHPPPPSPTIHIGCAGWHNLDLIAFRRSTYGLIVDFNQKNGAFIRKTIELIGSSPSRQTFKDAMIEYLNSLQGSDRDLFFHWDQRGSPTERIEQELFREGSWLRSDESYQYIKAISGRIVAIAGDMQDVDLFLQIRGFLDANGIAVDTLYLSNISNFMQTERARDAFFRSVRALADGQTIFIDCPRELRQAPMLGRDI